MPVEVGIWRIGAKPERVTLSSIDSEARLETSLAADISIVAPNLLLLGRQVPTAFGKIIDLLAIDQNGKVFVIELKKNRTPRDAVAQLLDYGSWVAGLSYEELAGIYGENHPGEKLEQGFSATFGTSPPETLNESHDLVLVSSELDPSSERIINYLAGTYGVPVNAVFFGYFREGASEYLTRTWLIDPEEAEVRVSKAGGKKGSEAWNGRDFYVSLGEGENRSWEDCRKYGFVSGGGGRWYSQTLAALFPGARIFVNIPKTGYVGVGIVRDTVVPVREFVVRDGDQEIPILSAHLQAPKMGESADDPDLCEYLVRIEWLKTVGRQEAFWERGLFAIQHTTCKLRNKFTIERVAAHFEVEQ